MSGLFAAFLPHFCRGRVFWDKNGTHFDPFAIDKCHIQCYIDIRVAT